MALSLAKKLKMISGKQLPSSLPLGIIFTIQMGDLDELLADLKGFCKAREDGTSKTYAFTGPKKEVTSMFPQEGSVIKISN